MSTTIYGCYNKTTGEITFENLETCLEQSACFVVSGEHAGQVALTLSGADDEDCNDTFYGCINPTTGKFQISIPEDCCIDNEYYGRAGCADCFDIYKTPLYMTMTFSGVTLCPTRSWPGGVDLNQTWKLTYVDYCEWEYYDSNWWIRLLLRLEYPPSQFYTFIAAGTKASLAWFGNVSEIADCTYDSQASNQLLEEECGILSRGYGGSANWCPFWYPYGCP